MRKTARDIMAVSFREALEIVGQEFIRGTNGTFASVFGSVPKSDTAVIAASNMAIALFSYKIEMEAMKNAQEKSDETDDDDPGDGFGA